MSATTVSTATCVGISERMTKSCPRVHVIGQRSRTSSPGGVKLLMRMPKSAVTKAAPSCVRKSYLDSAVLASAILEFSALLKVSGTAISGKRQMSTISSFAICKRAIKAWFASTTNFRPCRDTQLRSGHSYTLTLVNIKLGSASEPTRLMPG